jgi:hypothetical protein
LWVLQCAAEQRCNVEEESQKNGVIKEWQSSLREITVNLL